MADKDKVSIYAVGDVGVTRANPESAFTNIAPVLNEPDILFGQLEASLSQKGTPPPTSLGTLQKPNPNVASVLKSVGFDVMSFASNHTLDWGAEGLLDTMNIAKQKGITLCGVGKDINEARQPAILERKGVKVAFLGYNTVLPPAYWATADRAGCAPVRVHTFYEPFESHLPGTPSQVFTYAYKEDLQAMLEDIKKVKPLADIVALSIHWGIAFTPAKLAMYQQEVGYAAIDAGADLIIGTHAHILKGIEVYKGKVIFYSLGNFAIDSAVTKTWPLVPARWKQREIVYNFKIDPDWGATYPFPADSRKTILAKCIISDKKIEKVSFLPVLINKPNQPEVMHRKDKGFDEVSGYMKEITESQGLNAKYQVDGDEVVISN